MRALVFAVTMMSGAHLAASSSVTKVHRLNVDTSINYADTELSVVFLEDYGFCYDAKSTGETHSLSANLFWKRTRADPAQLGAAESMEPSATPECKSATGTQVASDFQPQALPELQWTGVGYAGSSLLTADIQPLPPVFGPGSASRDFRSASATRLRVLCSSTPSSG